MSTGTLESIFITETKGQPLRQVESVEVVLGRGLAGDRYYHRQGTWTNFSHSGREVTLIEVEAIDAASRQLGMTINPADARRNLLTRGVSLNDLVGQHFQVGAVVMRGIRLCEPCRHLNTLTFDGFMQSLIHRGGLRADIVFGGEIYPGDTVKRLWVPSARPN